MTSGTRPTTLRSTPDWIRQANDLDDDAFSEASLDTDDMSISDSSYDGDIEMFPGDGAPCNSTTSGCSWSPSEGYYETDWRTHYNLQTSIRRDVNGNVFINFIGCYGAAHGDHKYNIDFKEYKYGHTRNAHRTHVHHIIRKILGKELNPIPKTSNGLIGPKNHITGEIILGDLQEITSTTARDNLGGVYYNPPTHGILNAIRTSNRQMISVIREHENHVSFITRESLGESKSDRGISHILVDPRIDDMYVGGCVPSYYCC